MTFAQELCCVSLVTDPIFSPQMLARSVASGNSKDVIFMSSVIVTYLVGTRAHNRDAK